MHKPLLLQSLHHIRVQVPDVAGNVRFANDFGLHEVARTGGRIYFRAAGVDAYSYVVEQGEPAGMSAVAFLAESRGELERAVREHGASPVRELEGPGGGVAVSLRDPQGTVVDLVHGIAERAADPLQPLQSINYPGQRQRFNSPQTHRSFGPACPLRLGHIGLVVTDFKAAQEWYGRVLGLTPTDRFYAGHPGNHVGGFFRMDRGAEWVDHHVVGLFGMGKPGLHHMSFEVQDIEQQMVAHRHLRKAGHQSVWGVGRHPLGSHVFDLWKDPNGLRFETFSDTDLYNNERSTEDHDVTQSEMDLWSNDSPERYFA